MSMQLYQQDIILKQPEEHAGKPAKFIAFRVPLEWHALIYANDALWKTWVTPLTNTNRQRPGAFDGPDGEKEFLMYARLHAHFQHGILFDYTADEKRTRA